MRDIKFPVLVFSKFPGMMYAHNIDEMKEHMLLRAHHYCGDVVVAEVREDITAEFSKKTVMVPTEKDHVEIKFKEEIL